jgi:hypothetical protein
MKYNRRKFIKASSILIGSSPFLGIPESWGAENQKGINSIQGSVPVRLRCEYLENPLGIDTNLPRFSWEIIDSRRAVRQNVYQVLVASSLEILSNNKGDFWDSERVESDKTVHIEYKANPLESGTICYWKVRIWTTSAKNKEIVSIWSNPAIFSIGLLKDTDWKAEWVTASEFIPNNPMPFVGYVSSKMADADDHKWVQIDLGRQRKIDGVGLHPAVGKRGKYSSPGGENAPGSDFPLRFKIEVSSDEYMNNKTIVADYTQEDFPSPGKQEVKINFQKVKGRYIRLTSMKQLRGFMVLAGMEVLLGGVDLAKGCKATALDSYEDISEGYGISMLTAGKTKYDGGNRRKLRPSPILRGEFSCRKVVKRAIAYASALGNYKLYFNGTCVNDDIFWLLDTQNIINECRYRPMM